jgi:hypothetical protein
LEILLGFVFLLDHDLVFSLVHVFQYWEFVEFFLDVLVDEEAVSEVDGLERAAGVLLEEVDDFFAEESIGPDADFEQAAGVGCQGTVQHDVESLKVEVCPLKSSFMDEQSWTNYLHNPSSLVHSSYVLSLFGFLLRSNQLPGRDSVDEKIEIVDIAFAEVFFIEFCEIIDLRNKFIFELWWTDHVEFFVAFDLRKQKFVEYQFVVIAEVFIEMNRETFDVAFFWQEASRKLLLIELKEVYESAGLHEGFDRVLVYFCVTEVKLQYNGGFGE